MAGNGHMTNRIACKWCGQTVDATHGADVCLKTLDRDLEASVKASERRAGTIKAHIHALDEYMKTRGRVTSRSKG
jgi:hypothetical protein